MITKCSFFYLNCARRAEVSDRIQPNIQLPGQSKAGGRKLNTDQQCAEIQMNKEILTLLVRVLQGPGGRRAILPRLRAQVVVETRTSGHRLGVEVSRERAILEDRKYFQAHDHYKP